MSLKKKDPSLRVAANDPHLVSLGGGRLSTAVTIHYIPIGDTTIGSCTTCSISLNGTGVRPTHCTIYRSEENEVTIVPEHDARILIDGTKITHETNLTQGAMITIGNSNYLRFNNPAEAQMMRSAMGSNERISMPQIDFTQVPQQQQRYSTKSGCSNGSGDRRQSMDIDAFYESKISPEGFNNVTPIDINGLQCPKVFTADLVTVNMPAKDVLGQKYANFARNLAENHRNDKNINNALRNNQMSNLKAGSATTNGATTNNNYANIPNNSNSFGGSQEYLTKLNNMTPTRVNSNAYDRYPKPGSYGGLQIFPMNGVNTEMNATAQPQQPNNQKSNNCSNAAAIYDAVPRQQQRQLAHLSSTESERLEDMLKICTEYADRQNQSCNSSITSSPIVQNRIKTNGSLPRDKKSPFAQHDGSLQLQQGGGGSSSNLSISATSVSSGYENVRLLGQQRVEINGQLVNATGGGTGSGCTSPKTVYENVAAVVGGKYVPQSPRTKIRTNCLSPKKEQHMFSNAFAQLPHKPPMVTTTAAAASAAASKQREYEQLIQTFEQKLELEMQAIDASSRYQSPAAAAAASLENSPARRSNKNINNLTLNLHKPQPSSLQNSPRLSKKPAPAPRSNAPHQLGNGGSSSTSNLPQLLLATQPLNRQTLELPDVEMLQVMRKELATRIERLKREIAELQKQENEVLRELDMEKALVTAELHAVGESADDFEQQLQSLLHKIHRLEAQRNATRVMEENQQAKLKQSIEMKQDQVKKLKAMLKQKPNNDCLKQELHNVAESLDNDRKTFEDLEFHYLEEESEWQAYREELHADENTLAHKIQDKRRELQHLQSQELTNQTNASTDAKALKQNLSALLHELRQCQERLKSIELSISDITGQLNINSSSEDEPDDGEKSSMSPAGGGINTGGGIMSQSLFGSAELLCPKRSSNLNLNGDIMSKSINENMFYTNSKIELPPVGGVATSTPKRAPPPLQVVAFDDDALSSEASPPVAETLLLRHKYKAADGAATRDSVSPNERMKFNLSLGSDDFEVNPLEKRVPSQDDIDRISKVTLDAPISTQGASDKIFDSIKEIERNRQLLLAQQGHHVIEHERQKMQDLKKKCSDEARAQYLSMLSVSLDSGPSNTFETNKSQQQQEQQQSLAMQQLGEESERLTTTTTTTMPEVPESSGTSNENNTAPAVEETALNQLRHSQPEFDAHQHQHHHHPHPHQQQHQQLQPQQRNSRPLSESNSELSCDLLSENNTCKSNLELSTATSGNSPAGKRYSGEQNTSGSEDAGGTKRASSVNSNDTTSAGSGGGERKRALPKHQRPLTRYLPIFSPDLNLRHHIESAGHQIALCPHVLVDSYSCRGYLHKLGATFHGWARRWFVLDRQRNALIYFSDKSERKPRGGAYFATIDEVYLDHLNASKSGRPHCTFIVKTKKRSYQLQAASDAAARIWIDAIITGAQGNLDY